MGVVWLLAILLKMMKKIFEEKNLEYSLPKEAEGINQVAKKFINDLGNPYSKILLDKDGSRAIEWGAYGVPETFLIFGNQIIKRYIGPLNSELILEIESFIE